jgi:hypothetical protein
MNNVNNINSNIYSQQTNNNNINNQIYNNNNNNINNGYNNYTNTSFNPNNNSYMTGTNMFTNNLNKQIMTNYFNNVNLQPKGPANLYSPEYNNTISNNFLRTNNINNINNKNFMSHMGMDVIPENPISISSNYINIEKKTTNSSLICCLKIFFYCFGKNLYEIIQIMNSYSQYNQVSEFQKTVLNSIKFIGEQTGNSAITNNISFLRKQLSTVLRSFSGNTEIPPFVVYHDLFTKLNEELRIYNNFYPNIINTNLYNITGIDLDYFPDFKQKIDNFRKTTFGPITLIFYFFTMESFKCPTCNNIFKADVDYKCFLKLKAENSGSITSLLNDYFNSKINNNDYYNCTRCQYNIKPIKNYSFLMPPLYLVIYFEGKDLTDKKLDEVITLPRYLGRIEPMKYTLFAFIKENNNTHDYIAFIKFNNIWFEYNTEKMEKVEFPIFDSIYPYIVIYKSVV